MNVVILAGGGGTRLWPMSRATKPKQFQPLVGERTLLELTRQRLGNDFPESSVYFSVTEATAPFVRTTFPRVANDHLIIEPEKRDTGPAMGFAAAILEFVAPDEPLAFLPADHYIADEERFRASLHVSEALIRETGKLLDIGVPATWPNTNLGYTHIGGRVDERDGVEIFSFLGHTEKPPLEQAKQFLAGGDYLWHASYYMWTPKKFLEAYAEHAPATHAILRAIQKRWREGDARGVKDLYCTLEKVSIDYAITEKLDPAQVLIIKAPFDWSDVGMWSVLKKLREENPDAVVTSGAQHVGVDTRDSLIYGPAGKVIATVGVNHLAIVDTGDALLVADLSRDQEIKKIVEALAAEKRDDVL